jgi:hypothetical protein
MFGSKREEMTGDWVEYNDEDIHDYLLFTKQYSGDKIEESKMIRLWGASREEKTLDRSGGES